MNIPTYVSGAIFAQAHRILREAVRDVLRNYELTPTSWSLIGAILATPDGIRLVTLAERLGVKAPLITAIANDLVEKGFIRRVPHHTDRRAKLLVITPSGKLFAAKVEQDVERALGNLLVGLTEKDLSAYKKVLETVISNGSH